MVGIRIIHPVILFFLRIPQRIVNHISAFLPVRPHVCRIPKNLRSPNPLYPGIVTIHIRRIRIGKDGGPLAEIESHGFPVYQIVTAEQVYPMVEPGTALAVAHVRRHHHVPLAVVRPANISIARPSLLYVVHGSSSQQVFVMQAVPAQGVCRPFSTSAHVTV